MKAERQRQWNRLLRKVTPSFKIVIALVSIAILYAMGLPLTYAYAFAH